MKHYWEGLARREQLMIAAGGVVIFFVLYFLLAIDPQRKGLASTAQQIQWQLKDRGWMLEAQQEIKQLTTRKTAFTPAGSLFVTVDRKARALQVKPELKRLEPDGDHKVRLVFEKVEFKQLTLFLAQLQQQNGILIDSLTLSRAKESGRVDTRITLTNTP